MIRSLLVLLCVAFVVLALLGMRRGWRSRLGRQDTLPSLPAPPADPGPASLSVTGLYVGSAFATSWQDRVLHGGLGERADAQVSLHDGGLLVARQGGSPIWVPGAACVGARLAPGLAGKVVGAGGLLVVRWRLGDAEIDTGLRADDKSVYPAWVDAINGRVAAVSERASDEVTTNGWTFEGREGAAVSERGHQ